MPPFRRTRSAAGLLVGALALAASALRPAPASAASPFLIVPDPQSAEASPAYRYANMTDEEALAELDRRQILYQKVDPVHGVRAPIRLTGRLHGVYFHSSLPPEQRVSSIFEILDARLALALDDFAAVLERHDIDEVVHYTMYRPNVPPPGQGSEAQAKAKPAAKPEEAAAAKPEPAVKPEAAPAAKPEAAPAAKPEPAPAPAAKPEPAAKPSRSRGKGSAGSKREREEAAAEAAPILGKGRSAAPKKAETVTAPVAPAKAGADRKGKRGRPSGRGSLATRKSAPAAAPASASASAAAAAAAPASAAAPAAASAPVAAAAPAPASASRKAPSPAPRPRGQWAPPGTRHPAGLAIDVGALRKRDGTWLRVANHFDGHLGERTCGEGARVPERPEARELRALVCESMDGGIFTYVLTPNYNAAHADHYHMEIKPGVRWFLVH